MLTVYDKMLFNNHNKYPLYAQFVLEVVESSTEMVDMSSWIASCSSKT